tara:strand:+ start:229 stop:465 length:237 start_codon:yes stop_codon:yes gene_type:complete
MKTTAQKSLFKHLLNTTEIDDIQCRYIAFKLAENDVKAIINIKQTETLKYTLKTNNGSYKVEATDLPLPISKVERLWT